MTFVLVFYGSDVPSDHLNVKISKLTFLKIYNDNTHGKIGKIKGD